MGSEALMNHSICSADRATHAKIVAMALFLSTVVTGLSLFLHTYSKAAPAEKMIVLKASATTVASTTIVIVH
jgi:hypothetical protein